MPSTLLTLRNRVVTAIETARLAGSYPVNDFEVKGEWLPQKNLEDFAPGGQVWVVGMNYDDSSALTRQNLSQAEYPIAVGIQSKIDPTDDNRIALLHELEEEIRDTCRKSVTTDDEEVFAWLRNEALKDENGTPFAFVGMRQGIFEAYFTAYYQAFLE